MQQLQRVSWPRVPALDGVRGLAILWVLSHQLGLPMAIHGWEARMLAPFVAGWIGVQLFFVLSGFLITGILLDTQHDPHQLKHFYVRRVLRIFPLYYATLAVTMFVLSVWPASLPHDTTLAQEWAFQPWLWFFLSNWTTYTDQHTAMFPHFWSLAVEEQFYVLWPLLIYKRSPQAVFRWGWALALGSLAFRVALHHARPTQDTTSWALYGLTPSRFDALALGAVAAAALRCPELMSLWQQHSRRIGWATLVALLIGAKLTWGFRQWVSSTQVFGYSVLAWTFGYWILSLATSANTSVPATSSWWWAWLRWGWLRKVGEVSFGMYVLHLPLNNLLQPHLMAWAGVSAPYSLGFSMVYVLTMTMLLYGLARLSFTWFESPLLRLKDQWAAYAPPPATKA
jgi:peptidoglycan/LPS O-acetylase OafA/YrhL